MNSRVELVTTSLLTLMLCAWSASPQQIEPLSLDLSDVAIDTILNTFAQITDSRLEKDPGIGGRVTFRFAAVHWDTALSAICQSAGCRWQLEEGRERVLRISPRSASAETETRSQSISLSLNRAPLQEVFESIAKIDGAELDLDPAIDGEISIHFDSIMIDTSLDALCESVGCSWRRHGRGNGRLEIRRAERRPTTDPMPSAEERLARPINLDLDAANLGEVLASLSEALEVEPDLPQDLHGEVSLELHKAPIREALDRICGHFFLDWSLARDEAGTRVLRVRPVRGDFGDLGGQEVPLR